MLPWFGAKCDGISADDDAFNYALSATSTHGGTIVVPSGRTCAIATTIDLGHVCPPGTLPGTVACIGKTRPATGVTIRGSSMEGSGSGSMVRLDPSLYPSTILFSGSNPADCAPAAGGGFLVGPGAGWITFEDLAISGGPTWSSCLINDSRDQEGGDPIHVTLRHVNAFGNAKWTTSSGIFLSRASYVTIDSSLFMGVVNAVRGDGSYDGQDHGRQIYVNNLVITNSIFYSRGVTDPRLLDSNPMVYLPNARTTGLSMTGNAFEYGPNGVSIYAMQGGDITGNWFEGENANHPTGGAWLHVNSGQGCTITGNWMDLGYDGIYTQGYAEVIQGNHFGQRYGTAVTLKAGAAIVEGNVFAPGLGGDKPDIDVVGGTGHRIGPNAHSTANPRYLNLGAGTRGLLFGSALTTNRVADASHGGWTKLTEDTLMVGADLVLRGRVGGNADEEVTSASKVAAGTAEPEPGLEIGGGMRLTPSTARPVCNERRRGLVFVLQGGTGAKDRVYVCAKDAGENYGWRALD
jgi:hypothetical protein